MGAGQALRLGDDVERFFPSIDHAILRAVIRRTICDPGVLWLIDRIIDGAHPSDPPRRYFAGDDFFRPEQHRRGLPIGNLTSQFFGMCFSMSSTIGSKTACAFGGTFDTSMTSRPFTTRRTFLTEVREAAQEAAVRPQTPAK